MASSSKQSWQIGDAGILRKKEEEEELLVFGYSCKLFRDDEKALYIDQGKHLIPWMGDDTLKIDRYDGRGALYDLKQCEALPGGYDENLWVGLSDSERHVEQLCNEERYRSLNRNEEEEALHQEEELKRLHQALDGKSYGEVGFDYNKGSGPTKADGDSNHGDGEGQALDDEDQPFVAPPELDIPLNMVLPDRVKLNAIIEKTALFISSQGAQMEILLKMKQAKNPQFEFLSYDSPLHPYYRYLQMAIKTGRYHPKSERSETEENPEDDDSDDDYLHPSLAPSSRVELAPSIPSIAYKPSADCAYSMLVNRIKDKQAAFSVPPPGTSEVIIPPPAPVQTVRPVPLPVFKSTPLVIEATPVLYNQPESAAPETAYQTMPSTTTRPPVKIFTPVTQVLQTAAPLAAAGNGHPTRYATGPVGYTNNIPKVTTSFLTPPQDVQLIIDKMASYVAKNGRDFESIVRSKGDPRFEFLQVAHQYYPYYLHKVDMYEQIEKPKPVVPVVVSAEPVPAKTAAAVRPEESSESDEGNGDSVDEMESQSLKPLLAPVCFSIKKPKDSDAVLDKKSALPQEESSDEEGKEPKESSVGEPMEDDDTELIDLTDETAMVVDIEELYDKDRKNYDKEKWEERVKDKLAAAARGKLAATSRDRQLQLERKRRAAAFLTMIHKAPSDTAKLPASHEATPKVSGDEDDVSSVASLPSSLSRGGTPAAEDAVKAPSSLLARIQGGRDMERRVNRESSSDSDHRDRRRPKKNKSTRKRDISGSPESRSHKHKKEDGHKSAKKSKKRERSPTRTPIKSHRSDRHNYETSSKSREGRSSKKKSQKKSRRHSDADCSSEN